MKRGTFVYVGIVLPNLGGGIISVPTVWRHTAIPQPKVSSAGSRLAP